MQVMQRMNELRTQIANHRMDAKRVRMNLERELASPSSLGRH